MSTSPPASRERPDPPPPLWKRALSFLDSLLITFSLYVLSIGPMYWQWVNAKYVVGSPLLAAFYEPLRILSEMFPPLGTWINWYVRWWIL